jgi:hypothetical protein
LSAPPSFGSPPFGSPPPFPAVPAVHMGLWGPPQSGKTTFLAALKIAATEWRGSGHWIMNGVDDDSSEFLIESTDLLSRESTFPSATVASRPLAFRFNGTESVVDPANARRPAQLQRVAFDLEVLDVPGDRFDVRRPVRADAKIDDDEDVPVPDTRADADEQLIGHLADCKGIVFLFDPVRNARKGDAFQYFHRVIEKLSRTIYNQLPYQDPRLPHHVAVCVTKFDDPEVYQLARRFGLTMNSEYHYGQPYVPDIYGYEFFRRLCAMDGGANLLHSALGQYFHPERIRVFITSAVGFYIGPSQRFRPYDHDNVYRDDGKDRIKGDPHPINVLEPIVWLQSSIRYASRPQP